MIFMIPSSANVFNISFQMRVWVLMPEWRRCLAVSTPHNLYMLRLSLQNRLLAVFAVTVIAKIACNERVVYTKLVFLVETSSTDRVYSLQDPRKAHPTL